MDKLNFTILLTFAVVSGHAVAHGGGLDKNGGHYNRKTGVYHCHRASCVNSTQKVATETRKVVESKLYNRKEWKHWSDFDNDCMNTRHEILLAQADGPVHKSPDGCYVSKGVWNDPFSSKQLTKPRDLDVDHVIPLKWANDHGGAMWSSRQKERFANDPINLLVVDDGLNQAKGAKGPDVWLPPNNAFRCEYLTLWQQVLRKYTDLQMKAAENRVFNRQLKSCN